MRYLTRVSLARKCSKPMCTKSAVATLTYAYADCTAYLGPLATYAEPHYFDLCQEHSETLTVPRGWEVVRLKLDPEALKPSSDDLEALADAVREAGRPRESDEPERPGPPPVGTLEVNRRGHLRVLRDAEA